MLPKLDGFNSGTVLISGWS